MSLQHVTPPTRRQVEVPSSLTLAGLHHILLALFGWRGDHLYIFEVGRRSYADDDVTEYESAEATLADVAGHPGKAFIYTYDPGPSWRHKIVVDAVGPAEPAVTYPRCLTVDGPNPGLYDGDRPRPVSVTAINKRLAGIRLLLGSSSPTRLVPASEASSEIRLLAAEARETTLLQDLVRLARWTHVPRKVTPTGSLQKAEVPGALTALRLPLPPRLHAARQLPELDAQWRLAEDLGLIDISNRDAVPGRGLACLDDDAETVDLWVDLFENAAVDARTLMFRGRLVTVDWLVRPLLEQLWRTDRPLPVAALAGYPLLDQRHAVELLDQIGAVGGLQRLAGGRWQLTRLGRYACDRVLVRYPSGWEPDDDLEVR